MKRESDVLVESARQRYQSTGIMQWVESWFSSALSQQPSKRHSLDLSGGDTNSDADTDADTEQSKKKRRLTSTESLRTEGARSTVELATGLTPRPNAAHQHAFRYRFRKEEQVQTLVLPADDADKEATEFYEQHLRPVAKITPSKLKSTGSGSYVTITPSERKFVPVTGVLPQVSSYNMQRQFLQMYEHEATSDEKKEHEQAKKNSLIKVDKRCKNIIKDTLPPVPAEPNKMVIFTLDCSQPKSQEKIKVQNNKKVMNYVPANNKHTQATYAYSTSSSSSSENRDANDNDDDSVGMPSFEHTHLSANHFKQYQCKTVFGNVDVLHPDDSRNFTEAPKVINSQMMPAELVVDTFYDHIFAAHQQGRLADMPGSDYIWTGVNTDNAEFNAAYNEAATSAKLTHLVVGVLVKLQKDEANDITHNADKIQYFISWNNELIAYEFDVSNLRTPSLAEVMEQRQLLYPLFAKYFTAQDPAEKSSSSEDESSFSLSP